MSATTAEIRNKAAKKLGLFGTGQTLRSEISADLDDAYTEVYTELKGLDLTTWTSTGAVPDEMVWPMVALVAFARVNEYSVPSEKYARIANDVPLAMAKLRDLTAQAYGGTVKIEQF